MSTEGRRWAGLPVQNVRLTMLDKFMFDYAKRALEEFRKCFSVRRGKDPRTTGLFHSPSSGIIITLGAIHLCDKVSVYGIAEDVHVNAPYQVRSALSAYPLICTRAGPRLSAS